MRLTGTCNQCGLCCYAPGVNAKCENLEVKGVFPGVPNATRCMAYNRRYDGMPIRLLFPNGEEYKPGEFTCGKDSWKEMQAILPHIDKGCSLEVGI